MKILVTGSTGFIGQKIVTQLASDGHELYLLVRKKSIPKAKKMFHSLENIHIIPGDLHSSDVIAFVSSTSLLLKQIECVVHLAGVYNFEASLNELYMGNVVGTQNILNLTKNMESLKYFHYFSTYAVNPQKSGLVSENDLADNQSCPDDYAKTKNSAEHLVRTQINPAISTTIYRPGIIVGDSKTGHIEKQDGPYYIYNLIHLIKQFKIPLSHLFIPTKKESIVPILPVDVLADWCSDMIRHPHQKSLRCYHLVPKENILTRNFLQDSANLLGSNIRIVPIQQGNLMAPILPFLKIPKETIFYMNQEIEFGNGQLEEDYPHLTAPLYKEYLPNLIQGFQASKQ